MSLLPPDGHLVWCAEESHLARARSQAAVRCKVTTYGDGGTVVAKDVVEDDKGLRFHVVVGGVDAGVLKTTLSGRHGVLNALGAHAILTGLGLTHDEIAAGMETFPGVKRRMEVKGTAAGVVVVDDFAHHPTAVKATLEGALKRYAGRPLWALFEPRSATSCRKIFQDDYARAFDGAARVLLAPPGRQLDPAIALDVPRLAVDVTARGVPAVAAPSIEHMVQIVKDEAPADAVLLCMSNGGFGGIHDKLLAALKART